MNAKNYETVAEHEYRLRVFSENLALIELHNSQDHSWTMEVNQFADLTSEEFQAKYLGVDPLLAEANKKEPVLGCSSSFPSGAPASIDHSTSHGVNAVKSQG